MRETYFDYNATTPLEPRVLEAMLPWLGAPGNASSVHGFGRRAREATETARDRLAALLDCGPAELVFTASGTEANNTVFETVAATCDGGHVVLSDFEHPSVSAAAARLAKRGFEVTRVRPEATGVIAPEAVGAALRDDTRLVCLMRANNEIGTRQPVAAAAALAHARGARVLCDAVQAVGKMPVSAIDLGVDYLTVGAHKFYGPLGAAALWVRSGVELEPFLIGGSHERRRRAGTLNVAAIVGMGAAADLARVEGRDWSARMAAARDRFEAGLSAIPDTLVHAADAPRLPNTSNVAFTGVAAEALAVRLDLRGFAISTGSACSSGRVEISATMSALGVTEDEALSSVRVSFGKDTSLDDVDRLLEAVTEEVAELRRLALSEAAR